MKLINKQNTNLLIRWNKALIKFARNSTVQLSAIRNVASAKYDQPTASILHRYTNADV